MNADETSFCFSTPNTEHLTPNIVFCLAMAVPFRYDLYHFGRPDDGTWALQLPTQ